jgi:hypothetical protein
MNKTITLLEKFLKHYTMEGTCGFLVQPDEDGGIPSVYIIFDLDWLKEIQTKPDFVARRMIQGLKEAIKNWTGIEVSYVGSITRKCNGLVNESISPNLKRRVMMYDFNEELNNVLGYEINPHLYTNVGDYISDVCDIMVNNLIDGISDYAPTPKEKDELYYYFVGQFSSKIKKDYDKTIKQITNESVKKIIITETQYKKLFEQKLSKIEMFQELIDEKLEYIRGFCDKDLDAENYSGDVGFESCDEVEIIDSIKVDEVNMMTGARTDMDGNMYDSTPSIYVKLIINYSSLRDRYDFDAVTYDIKYGLKKSTGLPLILDYRTNNLNKMKQ